MVDLSADQVGEDLACLKILLETHYAFNIIHPKNEIVFKLDRVLKNPTPMSSSTLLEKIFEFHEGTEDMHLGYLVGGLKKQVVTKNPVMVTLSEELEFERVYERPTFTYFRPESPMPSLTDAQRELTERLKVQDKPLVIDLRGNGGGDNDLAKALSESLFTQDQPVPVSEIAQIESPLQKIGFCATLFVIHKHKYRNYCEQVKAPLNHLPFSELIKTSITKMPAVYTGERSTPFRSPIVLITDSGCASGCETIIEKLSAHPMVKIIGAHTAGALLYGNPIYLTLPNSGIWVALPTRAEIYENDAPEAVGFFPDVPLTHVNLDAILSIK
ncbi:MAG: S41 family peptidase [Pseudobdellovibrionaceae bacterium]